LRAASTIVVNRAFVSIISAAGPWSALGQNAGGRLRLLLSGVRMLMSLGRVFAVRLGNVFAKLGRYIMFVSSHC